MDLKTRWSPLAVLIEHAADIGDMEIWVFGSMLVHDDPADLDVAVIYDDRAKVTELRGRAYWELESPPVDILCLTHDEDSDLGFLSGAGARRLA